MSNPWRLAKSLERLRTEVNTMVPGRDKSSDGTIGDAAHASRSSDHNPWVMDGKMGVVTGMDITHNPARGLDVHAMAERVRLSRDPRIKYIISNRRIASFDKDWKWRPYSGKNPHDHHAHFSVRQDKKLYDDVSDWVIEGNGFVAPEVRPEPTPESTKPLLVRGNKGDAVEELQKLLGFGPKDADAIFGPKTEAAVKKAQKSLGLVADGKVGRSTWAALLKKVA